MKPEKRNADGTFVAGTTGNPGGLPKWVREARRAIRGRLWELAQRHLDWVLSGEAPPDASKSELALYEGATLEDRNTAARLVMEYSIPKPKAQVGVKHEGNGPVVVEVHTLAEDKANG